MTHAELPSAGASVGIIAGGGKMPFAVAEAMASRGIRPVIFAIKSVCDPELAKAYDHHWIAIGQLGRLFGIIRQEQCKDVLFIGTLVRPAISEIRLDWRTISVMRHVFASFRGGDDHLLTGVGKILEAEGIRLIGVRDVAPELLMPEGRIARAKEDVLDEADIALGREVLSDLSKFDIGQACVVIDGHVVAVEGIEGTDAMLERVAALRSSGRIRAAARRGVLVKAPKRNQDLRFDLPAFGPVTVENAAKAKLAGVAIAAGHAILAEPQRMIEVADNTGLFVTGMPWS